MQYVDVACDGDSTVDFEGPVRKKQDCPRTVDEVEPDTVNDERSERARINC